LARVPPLFTTKKALPEALSTAASKSVSRSHTTTRTDTALKRVSINSNPPITVKSFVRTFHQTRLQNSTHALPSPPPAPPNCFGRNALALEFCLVLNQIIPNAAGHFTRNVIFCGGGCHILRTGTEQVNRNHFSRQLMVYSP